MEPHNISVCNSIKFLLIKTCKCALLYHFNMFSEQACGVFAI